MDQPAGQAHILSSTCVEYKVSSRAFKSLLNASSKNQAQNPGPNLPIT